MRINAAQRSCYIKRECALIIFYRKSMLSKSFLTDIIMNFCMQECVVILTCLPSLSHMTVPPESRRGCLSKYYLFFIQNTLQMYLIITGETYKTQYSIQRVLECK